jgi:hypothetical protein
MKRSLLTVAVALVAGVSSSCSSVPSTPNLGAGTFAVTVSAVNGDTTLPTAQNLMRPTPVGVSDYWTFSIEALSPTGELDTSFNGFVGLKLTPGTVVAVTGTGARDSNIQLAGGKASGVVQVTYVYGPTNLWVEDLGYVPLPADAPPGTKPQCSNGIDDNDNGLIDYPADPGCYAADDDTEDGGTYAAGVSPAVQYRLPSILDVRGRVSTPYPTSATTPCPPASESCALEAGVCSCTSGGASTPYQNEAIEVATGNPAISDPTAPANENSPWLVVTALASNGFYVTDLDPSAVAAHYNSLFAYNFAVPDGMAVCDRITSLAGTANDFYGFTQLSFPSFTNSYTLNPNGSGLDLDCLVPEPFEILASFFGEKNETAAVLYQYESGLVRLSGYTIASEFGPGLALNNAFGAGISNCDFNGNGQIDAGTAEEVCETTCDMDPLCSEWTAYSARGEYKVTFDTDMYPNAMILIDTSVLDTFDPVANAGNTLPAVTGNLTEFSGGSLNWTVVARCDDDIVCPAAMGCTTQSTIPSTSACLAVHTLSDNDEGSN